MGVRGGEMIMDGESDSERARPALGKRGYKARQGGRTDALGTGARYTGGGGRQGEMRSERPMMMGQIVRWGEARRNGAGHISNWRTDGLGTAPKRIREQAARYTGRAIDN